MPKMTDDEIYAFIEAAPRTAKLATVRKDGSPHVVPVWVVLDGRDILFNAGADTVKGRCIAREPRVSMCFDDESPPFAFVSIDGVATISEDLDDMLVWATRIGGRYMGEDRAEEFGRRNAVAGELLIRVTPTRLTGFSRMSE
jgi:PPOX class probable F420-dependent enzyme